MVSTPAPPPLLRPKLLHPLPLLPARPLPEAEAVDLLLIPRVPRTLEMAREVSLSPVPVSAMPIALPAAVPFSDLVVSALGQRCLLPRVSRVAVSRLLAPPPLRHLRPKLLRLLLLPPAHLLPEAEAVDSPRIPPVRRTSAMAREVNLSLVPVSAMPTALPAAVPSSDLEVSALGPRSLLPRVNKAAASRAQPNWAPVHLQIEALYDWAPNSQWGEHPHCINTHQRRALQ